MPQRGSKVCSECGLDNCFKCARYYNRLAGMDECDGCKRAAKSMLVRHEAHLLSAHQVSAITIMATGAEAGDTK